MTDPLCVRCEKPMRADQAYACGSCGSHLRALLARTANLAGEAIITIAKLDEVPSFSGGQADDLGWERNDNALEAIGLPYRPAAAHAYRAALGELITWARHCCEQRGIDYADSGGLDGLCGFLASQTDWLRHRPEADEALKAIEDACRQIERIVDRPPDRVVVGMCPCGTWLYAIAGADTVACRACGTSYDVEASRQQLRDNLEDRLMTGAEIATMAAHLGIVASRESARNAIKVWAQRGRITAHGSQSGSPLYRFGDTLGLLIDAYARAA